jgi:hypothetical protein
VWKRSGRSSAGPFHSIEKGKTVGHFVDMQAPLSDDDYSYLVERGMKYQADAVVAAYGRTSDEPAPVDDTDEVPEYSKWTVAQLQEELAAREIEFDAKAKKADLAALLDANDAEEAATNPDA